MAEGSNHISSGFYPNFLDSGANPATVIEETIDRRRKKNEIDQKQNAKILHYYQSNSEAPMPPVVIYK
jgi:hypothetical protein